MERNANVNDEHRPAETHWLSARTSLAEGCLACGNGLNERTDRSRYRERRLLRINRPRVESCGEAH
jgi:hypothetical protein